MLLDLGAALRGHGAYWRAETLLRRALRIRNSALPEASPQRAESLAELARLYLATARYSAASRAFAQVEDIHARAGEEEARASAMAGRAVAERAQIWLVAALAGLIVSIGVLAAHTMLMRSPERRAAGEIFRKLALIGFLASTAVIAAFALWPLLTLPISAFVPVSSGGILRWLAVAVLVPLCAGALLGLLALFRIALGGPAVLPSRPA
jgi:hypothetical protein